MNIFQNRSRGVAVNGLKYLIQIDDKLELITTDQSKNTSPAVKDTITNQKNKNMKVGKIPGGVYRFLGTS